MRLRKSGEEGGVFPVFLAAVMVAFTLTLMLVHIGKGGTMRTSAQTAADAAALGAAAEIRDRALESVVEGFLPFAMYDTGTTPAAARRYAQENDATVTSVDYRGFLGHWVVVKVKTDDTLGGIFPQFRGRRATATAIATVDFPACHLRFGVSDDPKLPPPLLGTVCDDIFIAVGAPVDRFLDLFHVHLVAHAPPKMSLVLPIGSGDGNLTASPGSADLCAEAAANAGFNGDALVTIVAIGLAESGCRPDAQNVNTNGSIDYGLFQINSIHGYPVACLTDPQCNATAAFRISGGGTNFYPWCTYEAPACGGNGNASYRQYTDDARAAVARLHGKGNGKGSRT